MANERRTQERLLLNLQAKVSRIDDEDPGTERFLATVAANISSGGAFLEFVPPLPLASRVKVEFHLAIPEIQRLQIVASTQTLRQLVNQEQVWVQATGVVIRHEPHGMAVIFDKNYQISPMQPGSF